MGNTVVRIDGDGTDFRNLDDGVEKEEGVEEAGRVYQRLSGRWKPKDTDARKMNCSVFLAATASIASAN